MYERKEKSAAETAISEAETENIHNSNIAQAAEKIKCVIQRPGQISEIAEIENTLEAFQEIVGGYIEVMPLTERLVLIVNEEGKLKGLEPNMYVNGDCLVGTVIVTAVDGEEFRSLTVHEIQAVRSWLLNETI